MNAGKWGDKHDTLTTVYSDVDGCLINWPGPKAGSSRYAKKYGGDPIPNPLIVDYLKQKKKEGFTIVLWSIGGVEHCKWAAELCRIHDIVDHYIAKPSILIDDCHRWYHNKNRVWVNENGKVIEK